MREALNAYGFFAGFGIFAIAGWTTAAAMSGGAIPGANGASVSVTAPLALACLCLSVHCLLRLKREKQR